MERIRMYTCNGEDCMDQLQDSGQWKRREENNTRIGGGKPVTIWNKELGYRQSRQPANVSRSFGYLEPDEKDRKEA